jgi:predicted PurR-regulated permease PerM
MNQDMINKATLALLVIGISALFFTMIQKFLMVIFLAGLFSALTRPVFRRLNIIYKGRKHLASATTLVLMIFVVMIPLLLLIGIVVAQAVDVGQSITPWIRQTLKEPGAISIYLQQLPFFDQLEPYRETILKKAGELVGYLSKWVAGGLSSATFGTVYFVFLSFVFLYTMYFFQLDGDKLMKKILYYLPLDSADESVMLEKFTSVTRATLKGTMLIGILQGGLAGSAFAIAGIDNAIFWGTVMAVLSIIPSVGSAIIWIPAAIFLILQGSVAGGIGLMVFCGLVVGSLDNVLRPILVGKDTKMHELMIFFGTLGGIMMFGISGIFIGPLIASLFITIWELYGIAFSDYLPEVYSKKASSEAENAVPDKETGG